MLLAVSKGCICLQNYSPQEVEIYHTQNPGKKLFVNICRQLQIATAIPLQEMYFAGRYIVTPDCLQLATVSRKSVSVCSSLSDFTSRQESFSA